MTTRSLSLTAYPIGQMIVSVSLSILAVGIYFLILRFSETELTPDALRYMRWALVAWIALALVGILIRPLGRIQRDVFRNKLVIRGIWCLGLYTRKVEIQPEQVESVVYLIHGGRSLGSRTKRGGHNRYDGSITSDPKLRLLVVMKDGTEYELYPGKRTSRFMARRLGRPLAEHLGVPAKMKRWGEESPL